MNKIKVKVTEEHIAHGYAESCTKCPIALAIREQVKLDKEQTIFVRPYVATIYYNKDESLKFVSYLLPEAAHQFIKTFDKGREVEPFEFEMKEEN